MCTPYLNINIELFIGGNIADVIWFLVSFNGDGWIPAFQGFHVVPNEPTSLEDGKIPYILKQGMCVYDRPIIYYSTDGAF